MLTYTDIYDIINIIRLNVTINTKKGSKIAMPFTTIKVIEGVFTDEQKADMIKKVTEAMVEVEGESMRDLTWVTIEEVNKGDWAIGGKFPKPKPKGS
jgi:4-oxalocrotonate tautomerase